MFKVGDKKENRTVLVNVNRVSLWKPRRIFFKTVTDSTFSKISCLSSKQHRQQVCLSNFMNGLRIIPRHFHSSEIQPFQTICFKITRRQINKDYKEQLVDELCFLNITSAVGHKIVLIPDYFTSLSMYSYFAMCY